ncbi:oxygen-independent coproporphyrinogen-3 oxidase [Paracoccus halophilus]|uniref:Coproporphyrinogen-III oxidase n=1 Tax=Paracoccus halophilus TaxID=376733 RepID=A0A099F2P9_9RHOB|nr:oxygen-independent coproporphyrinogen III oxidase [Paracoccus halophilus]KGJ04955.1 coproporphyrinogen III oxidase [Paracoccus halophilus]SFA39352.1 oxygen-independent coproporphyrinogen-3 oxidase [Paracoccus halophilus]
MGQQSQLERLGLFDARVPRYTSYPTAPHFTPTLGEARFRQWIAAIPAGAAISLYMHVPFCRRLCWFCACRTQGTQSDDPVRAYARVLMDELAMLRAELAPGVKLSRLHWGGGTPTLMPPEMMRRVAGAVLDAFPLAEGAEFSVEIDPNEIDDARMDALAEAGLTRASIGVQDFDPEIQKTIGREQSFELTRRAVDMIRDRGIASLNADILYGLPHQDPVRIAQSVQKLLALSPDRVALYGYAHVPWMARRQVMIPSEALPDPQGRLRLFEVARELFLADGYDEIGIDHFARPGDGLAQAQKSGLLRRNFQGYTDDRAEVLIGLGASSISRFPQGYAQNAPATGAHTGAIRAGRFSTTRGHAFTAEDTWRARMIEALMCDFRIDAQEFIRDHGFDQSALTRLFAPVTERFGPMVEAGPHGLHIRPEGRSLTRMIAQMFDAYDMAASGHSSAI